MDCQEFLTGGDWFRVRTAETLGSDWKQVRQTFCTVYENLYTLRHANRYLRPEPHGHHA